MRVSGRQWAGTAGVVAMLAAGYIAIDIFDEWVGNWHGPLWMVGAWVLPFFTALAIGPRAAGRWSPVLGVVVALTEIIVPLALMVALVPPDVSGERLALLWAVFIPLVAAQGALGFPVGARVRAKSAQKRAAA
jgi:hypothetical protein